jgi:2,4-didehydro-3-deoxy-L-rhamnonate hydrolase
MSSSAVIRSRIPRGLSWLASRSGIFALVRIANIAGRAAMAVGSGWVDLAQTSEGRFGPTLSAAFERWDELREWADSPAGVRVTESPSTAHGAFGPPVEPRQVFAIGLNYRSHAAELGANDPGVPITFTKFPTCLAGPYDDIELSSGTVDWEVELVVVIGRRAEWVDLPDAWSYVAGLTVGQDISDRTVQFAAGQQYSLGKSYRTFGPVGPWVVSIDELDDPDDLVLGCSVDGEVVQEARTSELIFDVPRLVVELSAVLALLPGDVIFTGTPGGVGFTRRPPRYLAPGNVLESWIEGIGSLRNTVGSPVRDLRGRGSAEVKES